MENKEINYCPKCGNKLTGNEKFCSVCGSPVLDFFSNEKEQIISESQNKIYVKKKKSIVKRILVGGGILFIALIVFGIFLPEDESNVGSETVVETEKEAEDGSQSVQAGEKRQRVKVSLIIILKVM